MKLCVALGLLVVAACSGEPSVQPPDVDAQVEVESDTRSQESEPAKDSADAAYNPCVSHYTATGFYPRLLEVYCGDSNYRGHLVGYWDNLLGIECTWKQSTDKVRCLPLNEQSRPLYADSWCSKAVALVANGAPPYIGLDDNRTVPPTVTVYRAGPPWKGSLAWYLVEGVNGGCFEAYVFFSQAHLFYVGEEVPPQTFVEQ